MIIKLNYQNAENRDAEILSDISQIVLGTTTASGDSATNLNADSSTIYGSLWTNPNSVYALHTFGALSFTKKHYEDGDTGHWFVAAYQNTTINVGAGHNTADSTEFYYGNGPAGLSGWNQIVMNQATLNLTIVVTEKLFVINSSGKTNGVVDLISNGINAAFPETSKIAGFSFSNNTTHAFIPKVWNVREKKYEPIEFSQEPNNGAYSWSAEAGPSPSGVGREIHIPTGTTSIGAREIGRWQPWGVKSIYASPKFSEGILSDSNNKPFFATGTQIPSGVSSFSSLEGNNYSGGQIIIEGEL